MTPQAKSLDYTDTGRVAKWEEAEWGTATNTMSLVSANTNDALACTVFCCLLYLCNNSHLPVRIQPPEAFF